MKKKRRKPSLAMNILYSIPIVLFVIISTIGYWFVLDYMSIAYEKELDYKLQQQMEQIYE